MQERHSRVNFRKLVKDLADMYPDHPFDVVVTELVANSLDSKAKSISIYWDDEANVLTVADDGDGMDQAQFEEYHNLAAELKPRGSGIGFAGVGAKISFNIADKVITETRRDGTVHASDWHWSDDDSLVWSDVKANNLSGNGTQVEVYFNRHQIPPKVNNGYLVDVLRCHYLPLLITEFARSYEASGIYSSCPKFAVNGTPMEQGDLAVVMGLTQIDRFPVKNGNRSVGLGAIGLTEDDTSVGGRGCGVLLCAHGKVIKPELFGLPTGTLGNRLSGIVEIPELIQFVTTNKSDLKGGRGRYRELDALISPVSDKLKEFLAKNGVASVEQNRNQLSAKLKSELTKMVKSLPELQDFDGLLAKSGKLRRNETGDITASVAARQNTGESDRQGGNNDKDKESDKNRASRRNPLQQEHQGKERAKRQNSRRNHGPRVAFEEHPERAETAWLDSSTIIINSGHNAYCQRISHDQAKLTYCIFSIGVALDKAGLMEPADEFSYVDKFIAAWGAS